VLAKLQLENQSPLRKSADVSLLMLARALMLRWTRILRTPFHKSLADTLRKLLQQLVDL